MVDLLINIDLNNHSLEEIAQWVVESKAKCMCGSFYSKEEIKSYDHEGGYIITGFEKKQWVYFLCTNCDSDTKIATIIHKTLRESV